MLKTTQIPSPSVTLTYNDQSPISLLRIYPQC